MTTADASGAKAKDDKKAENTPASGAADGKDAAGVAPGATSETAAPDAPQPGGAKPEAPVKPAAGAGHAANANQPGNQAPGQRPQGPGQNQAPGQRPQGPGQNQAPGQRPQGPGQNQAPGQRPQGPGQASGHNQPQVQPQPAAEPDFHIRPTATPMRAKRRHWFVLLSFVQVVVIPLAICAWYLYAVAADQYASYLGFSVRTEENSSAIEILGGITDISGSSSSDTDILYAYLTSQELVQKADEAVDLRAIWSRVPYEDDPIFAFDTDGTIEDLLDHWKRKISIVYDSGTGLIDLRILAFDREDAKRIAEFLLTECSDMINNLSAIAREDSIKYSREELEVAVDRLKTARRNVTEFRNLNQIVDPTIDTQGQMGLLNTLQQQLAEALIEVDLLRETTRETDPRILQAQRRVAVIEDRIEAERRKLGIGTGTGDGAEAYANLVGEFESLLVDREFAETAYTSAQAAYDSALAEARRQSRYLAAHVRPTLAGKSEYPERAKLMGLIGLVLLLVWSISVLMFYSLRDRR